MSKTLQGQNWLLTPAADGRRYSKFPDGTIDIFPVYAYTPGADSDVAYQIYDPVGATWGAWIAGEEAGVGGTVTQVTGTPLAGPFTFTDAVDITPNTLAESDAVTISAEGHQVKIRRLSPSAEENWTNYVAYAVINGVESGVWRVYKTADVGSPPDPPPASSIVGAGVFYVWGATSDLDYSYVRGGQIVRQWRFLEPTQGNYDLQYIDDYLALLEAMDGYCTLQLNCNHRPDFIFNNVPYLPFKSHVSVTDANTPMYWHPFYYDRLLLAMQAIANRVNASPYKHRIIGFRLSKNAVSTEHTMASGAYPIGDWVVPSGVTVPSPLYNTDHSTFPERVFSASADIFGAAGINIGLFARASAYARNEQSAVDAVNDEGAGLFVTSGDAEPMAFWEVASYYTPMLELCRPGIRKGYAESWSAADGSHGGGDRGIWMTEEQWVWWRGLAELNRGVSWVAYYAQDIRKSTNTEFLAGFSWVNKYAGFHADAANTPGAWIAFREGTHLKGDYTFHFQPTNSASFLAIDVRYDGASALGNQSQRFSVWARRLAAGQSVTLNLATAFATSIGAGTKNVNVTYLNRGGGTLTVNAFGASTSINIGTNNNWQTTTFARSGTGSSITLTAGADPVTIHMIEVERG